MPNAFLRGLEFAKQATDRRRTEDQLAAARAQELEASQFKLENSRADRERSDAAFEANRQRFGDRAGNPTATGQLLGIETREKLQPFQIREAGDIEDERERERLNAAQTAGILTVKKGMDGGLSASETLASLPSGFRNAVGLDDAAVAELGAKLDENPALVDTMLAGLRGDTATGKRRVVSTREGTNAQGERVAVNVFSDGSTEVVDGLTPDNAFANKVVGDQVLSGNSDSAPIRGVGAALERGERAKARGRELGKVEGETAGEDVALSQRASNAIADRVEDQKISNNNVITAIDDVLGQVDWGSAGTVAALKVVGGSEPANVGAILNTIQANSAFNRLQQMRDNSKTGGALGQVSERELDLLRDAEVALSQSQSPAQLRANLKTYSERLANINAKIDARLLRDVDAGLVREASQGPTRVSAADFLSGGR